MRAWFVSVLICGIAGAAGAGEANRLTYLDANDPYYVSGGFARLATPQWIGESGVEAVVVLAIDDMRGHERWEDYLRPILERLKQIDGRAPVSIMTCQIEPEHPHLARWLDEGLSLEIHTLDHPCPLLQKGDFGKAKATFDGCVDLLARVPGNRPVAFRMPCCDSLNTPSPRFYAEIFNSVTPAGHYLSMDSSVFNFFTAAAKGLPAGLLAGDESGERFRRYLPADRSFVNTIENYPYPYVIGRLCWEFPCVTPSDWQAQHLQQPNNPRSVADMKAALDATVAMQGVFNLVFHPHGWIRNDQVIELIDHAVQLHGNKVKFLTFRECQQRLDAHLLDGQPLRAPGGGDNGVRLIDLNGDGWMDVVMGNAQRRRTRLWSPEARRWIEGDFPARLVAAAADGAGDDQARFGMVRPGRVSLWQCNDDSRGAWTFDGRQWHRDDALLEGLHIGGQAVYTSRGGRDQGVRFRDIDADNTCECLVSGPGGQAVFAWQDDEQTWRQLEAGMPSGTSIVDSAGRDAGLRFVDVDEDGRDDVFFSNPSRYSLDLFESIEKGWSRRAVSGTRPADNAIPPFVLEGSNQGAWFHSRHLWIQNETTDRLENLVFRRSFDDLLAGVEPQARTPEAALRSMRPRPGFEVELVAAEPLVMDPVAFAWGADGTLWVAEMADYPLGLDGNGQFGGRVRHLQDSDGDGRYDRSTVFLDGLGYPSGVMPWRDGVLVTCAPEIFFAADTDGDGRADQRRTLFKGFTEGNQQHRVNGLRWGLDNWVYCANGDSGGEIESITTGQRVAIGGRDFRIRPDQGLIDPQTGQTQFMRERDDWGNWFGSNNSNPMFHFVLADHYLRRNPHLASPGGTVQVSEAPGAALVFPLSRTLPRFNDFNAANRFTSACSSIIYRDELFGAGFEGNSFVCEPVHNLVHREVLTPSGVTFTSRRAADERQSEFLASTDNWFRPTMVRVGPDGALWVADMYRAVIEHPEWIPADWQKRIDLRAGDDKGRMYRVYPNHRPPRPMPRLDRLDAEGLVAALDSPSGWQRDMAQQLLVHAGDRHAAASLAAMLSDPARRPQARLHALCTLDGLGALTQPLLIAALRDAHPGVRRHAVRLAEPRLDQSPRLAEAVAALVDDADPQVRMQLACSLGEWHQPDSGALLARLARAGRDVHTTAAVLSSIADHNLAAMLRTVLSDGDRSAAAGLISRLMALAVALDHQEALTLGLAAVAEPQPGGIASWQLEALGGLLDALDRRRSSLAQLRQGARGDLQTALERLDSIFSTARKMVASDTAALPDRLLAVALLGHGGASNEKDIETLVALLHPQSAGELQSAAVDAVGRLDDQRVGGWLLAQWSGYTPSLRGQVLDVLLARGDGLQTLLAHLASGRVSAADLDASRRQRLLAHPDESISRLAEELLAGSVAADRQPIVEEYRSALELTGDAQRGALVFQKSCAACHRLGQVGSAVGPDLSALSDKSPHSMLVAIFDPNRAVEAKYVSYNAQTVEGLIYSGMLVSESGNSITLVSADGKRTDLLRGELEQLASSSKSLMPEGLEKELSPAGLADLLAFLGSMRAPRRTFDGNNPQTVRPEALRGEFWLLASQAEIYGSTLVYEPRYGNLGYWQSGDDHAVWSLRVERPGRYLVSVDYACPDDGAGNAFAIDAGGQRLSGVTAGTGNWDTYRQVRLGEIELPEGLHQLTVRPEPGLAGFLFDLKAVRLEPAG